MLPFLVAYQCSLQMSPEWKRPLHLLIYPRTLVNLSVRALALWYEHRLYLRCPAFAVEVLMCFGACLLVSKKCCDIIPERMEVLFHRLFLILFNFFKNFIVIENHTIDIWNLLTHVPNARNIVEQFYFVEVKQSILVTPNRTTII